MRLVPAVLCSLGLAASLSADPIAPAMAPALHLLDLKRPLVIAHRGDSAAAPENTLPAFAGARVPLVTEALATIQRGSVTLIERKAGDAATCARLLCERGLINHVVVQSFDWDFLRVLHALVPGQALGALGPTGPEKTMSQAHAEAVVQLGAKIIVWNETVTPEGIRAAHAGGLKVWIYTIDDPAKARALVSLGVDGIITNKPALIRAALPK